MKKSKLKKGLKKLKKQRIDYGTIYSSEFCVTDNNNFALFNVLNEFLVDNDLINALKFDLTEDDLLMFIDRGSESIKPSKGNLKVSFGEYGFVDRKYFNLMTSYNENCIFLPITEWFNKRTNRLLAVLPNKEGKPFGILKTVTMEN